MYHRKLEGLSKKLLPAQGNPNDGAIRDWCKRFLKASINEGIVEDCVKTVDRALVDYQVRDSTNLVVIASQHMHRYGDKRYVPRHIDRSSSAN